MRKECRRCGEFKEKVRAAKPLGEEIVQAWNLAWSLHKDVDEPHRVRPEGINKWLK